MDHPLRCACGTVRGRVLLPAVAGRGVCYCTDCRAFARFLKRDGILDANGGTDVVAVSPSRVRIEQGIDAVACMSLSPQGLFRWYASCCATPLGNTPRNPKVHYVGLVHACLAERPLAVSFGESRLRLNTGSALGKVSSTPVAAMLAAARLMVAMVPARFTGRYRQNPFFDPGSGLPIRPPHVVSKAERATLTA